MIVKAKIRPDSWCLGERSGFGVRLGGDHFLPCHRYCVKEGLHRRFAEAVRERTKGRPDGSGQLM